MKIQEVRIRNFMKIELLDIKPSGAVIQFAGKNGQGKTSAALAIIGALGGKKALAKAMKLSKDPGDEEIIRRGEQMSEVEVKFGGWVVTWTRKRGGAEKVEIRGSDGGAHGRAKLAEFIGAVTFDPLAVDAMSSAGRRATLLEAAGVDLEEIDGRRRLAFDNRRDVNRDHKVALARVSDEIDGAPEEVVDIHDLNRDLGKALAQHDRNRDQRQEAEQLGMRAVNLASRAADVASEIKRIASAEERSCALYLTTLESMEHRHAEELASLRSRQDEDSAGVEKTLEGARSSHQKLSDDAKRIGAGATVAQEEAQKLVDPPVDQLKREIEGAHEANELYRLAQERLGRQMEAEQLGADSRQLTDDLDAIDHEKTELLANAKMPIEGIELTGEDVTIGGHLWETASTSERLRVCVAISAALSPELKIAFIRSGNDLDAETCTVFEAECKKRGLQAWIERGEAAFEDVIVIENGMVAA